MRANETTNLTNTTKGHGPVSWASCDSWFPVAARKEAI